MKLVYLESPYKSYYKSKAPRKWLRKVIKFFMDKVIVRRNIKYAKLCMKDCLKRGEAPFVSHLLYTQVLNDSIQRERNQGIEAGLSWGLHAEKTVVYCDYGITEGMRKGIKTAFQELREVKKRYLYEGNIIKRKASPLRTVMREDDLLLGD